MNALRQVIVNQQLAAEMYVDLSAAHRVALGGFDPRLFLFHKSTLVQATARTVLAGGTPPTKELKKLARLMELARDDLKAIVLKYLRDPELDVDEESKKLLAEIIFYENQMVDFSLCALLAKPTEVIT